MYSAINNKADASTVSSLQSTVNTLNTYAIKSAGTAGQVWTSDGSGAGKWASITPGYTIAFNNPIGKEITISFTASGSPSGPNYGDAGFTTASTKSSDVISVANTPVNISSTVGKFTIVPATSNQEVYRRSGTVNTTVKDMVSTITYTGNYNGKLSVSLNLEMVYSATWAMSIYTKKYTGIIVQLQDGKCSTENTTSISISSYGKPGNGGTYDTTRFFNIWFSDITQVS